MAVVMFSSVSSVFSSQQREMSLSEMEVINLYPPPTRLQRANEVMAACLLPRDPARGLGRIQQIALDCDSEPLLGIIRITI